MALIAVIMLKSVKSSGAVFVLIAVTLICAGFTVTRLSAVISFINKLADSGGIEEKYIEMILKCMGICFLGEITSGICRDSGENTLAANSEIVCKFSIIAVSLPMYADIFNMIIKLWENI